MFTFCLYDIVPHTKNDDTSSSDNSETYNLPLMELSANRKHKNVVNGGEQEAALNPVAILQRIQFSGAENISSSSTSSSFNNDNNVSTATIDERIADIQNQIDTRNAPPEFDPMVVLSRKSSIPALRK